MKTRFIYFIALFLGYHFLYGQTVDRVEPPNWWIGMKDPNLQIMVYGKNISKLRPEINYKGVTLLKSTCPENKDYIFLDLTIKKNTKAGIVPILFFDERKQVVKIEYPLLLREVGSAERQGFKSSDVIYLITPDRFADGDPTNNDAEGLSEKSNRGNKNGRHGGDIEGMRQHLDYIADLGFTAIWPNPLLENNMPRYSYHGYAITDFYKVDPRMGTNESYKSFCQEASHKGIKVIMDMIINHCGLEHWWMKNPPTKDWINYYDKPYVQTSHRKTIQMDPYAAQEDHDVFTKGWFEPHMPDLNPLNPFLGKYLIQNSIWWIEYAGLSGIRMDTYVYPDENYMSQWSERVMNEYPDFTITGEVWHLNPAIVSHWQRGKSNTNGYKSYLPSLFDFPLQNALRNALMSPDEGDSGWAILYEMLAQDFQYPDPQNLVVFPDNHDMSRMYAQLKEDILKLKMAYVFTLTTRGIPEFFYGDEILMRSPEERDDGLIRSDFPGGWKGDKVNGFTGEGLTHQQTDLKEFIHRILAWRKGATAIQKGSLTHYVPESGVYVFFRYDKNEKVMVILNKNEKPVLLQLDRFRRMLGESTKGKEVITGKDIDLGDTLRLEQMGPLIIDIGE
ncbi:MAG: glycoside hydrolase family 13 protein [Saprospiraceae bacterium]|uniref:Glycoside hydrolase family 13 protein n=1 Tax=Candidatus Opimibacter skivensis TaxID=2982028 RepID=A0A9D7STN6_9BACT|nr:glycoside hydrolase family 13 protein [Candidatus Opimibacter skivensis]